MTDNPDLWGERELPGGLAREMQADDHRVLVLRSTASEAVTRGKNRVRVELAHVKGLVAALAEAATDSVDLPVTVGILRLAYLPEWGIALFTSFGYTVSEARRPATSKHPGQRPGRRGRPDRRNHRLTEPFASPCGSRGAFMGAAVHQAKEDG